MMITVFFDPSLFCRKASTKIANDVLSASWDMISNLPHGTLSLFIPTYALYYMHYCNFMTLAVTVSIRRVVHTYPDMGINHFLFSFLSEIASVSEKNMKELFPTPTKFAKLPIFQDKGRGQFVGIWGICHTTPCWAIVSSWTDMCNISRTFIHDIKVRGT